TNLKSSVRMREEAEGRRNQAVTRRAAALASREKAQQRRMASLSRLSVARLRRVWATFSDKNGFGKDLESLKKDVAALGLNSAVHGIDDITRLQTQLQTLEGSGQALVGAIGASFRD